MASHYPHEGGVTELPKVGDHLPGTPNHVVSGVRFDRASTEARAMALVPDESQPGETSDPASTPPTGSTMYPHEGAVTTIEHD